MLLGFGFFWDEVDDIESVLGRGGGNDREVIGIGDFAAKGSVSGREERDAAGGCISNHSLEKESRQLDHLRQPSEALLAFLNGLLGIGPLY